MAYVNTSYLHCIYSPVIYQEVVTKVAAYLELRRKDFDSLAFSGSSGAAIAYPVGALLGCHLSHARKNDGNHHGREGSVEGWTRDHDSPAIRYVIVDDFISSGATMERIILAMGHAPEFILLYDGGRTAKLNGERFGVQVVDRMDLGCGPCGWLGDD